MKRIRSVAAVPAVAALLLAGFTPALASENPLNSTGIPAKYTNQVLDWHRCTVEELGTTPPPGSEHMECATHLTPRDWNNLSDTRDLTIAISRLPATAQATDSVLINPGGPGAEGRIYPARLRFQDRLLVNQEVVGFDPRGTGRSTSISCGGALDGPEQFDPRNRDAKNLEAILDATDKAAQLCMERAGDLGPLMNTSQTVRDLDLLRVLLKRQKINWVGYSAGAWMGAHYATAFPSRVKRVLLDSPVEFTTSWERAFAWQPLGFERRWRQDFLPWMAKYDKVYGFGTTAEAARQTFETVRTALGVRPVKYNGFTVNPNILDSIAAEGIYGKRQFHGTATTLVDIRKLTQQSTSEKEKAEAALRVKAAVETKDVETRLMPGNGSLPGAPDSYPTNFWTVRCNEGPWPGDRASVVRQSQEHLDKQQTLVGGKWMVQPCIFWRKPPLALPTIDGRGLPPTLIVQSVHDPATAIEGTRRAHKAFAGSRMITVTDEGDHGLYAANPAVGNPDLDKVINQYLIDGVVPPNMTVPGAPLPPPPGA
ncbi:alpha/beta hydrolase [Allokutzneria multivorans]|uniref:Alpha/beta hydrolase n=1 Tax=Allokutzneria multivorans TaxID=1142134 RepID=A0ABP7TX12_9PSEU